MPTPFQSMVLSLLVLLVTGASAVLPSPVQAQAMHYGLLPNSTDPAYQQLIYGASTPTDVQRSVGEPPDEVVKNPYIYPVVENHVYYERDGSENATVFVFENGLLVGMHLRTASNQYVDLTYFLINNGDRALNFPIMAGTRGYYPYFPFFDF